MQKIKSTKTLLALLLISSLTTHSYAQTSRFSIALNSLTTNFNYGSANSNLKSYKKDYRGFQAGISYQAGITPVFSIVPEIYFAMKGGTLKKNNPLTGGKSTLRINSLELPVLARLHYKKFYLNVGPYAGYHVGGRLKVEELTSSVKSSTKVSFGKDAADLKRWDLGFQAGAGYNFNLKQSTLTLDVRYAYGLVNISQDIDRYNRMLNISLQVSRP
ncbi:porin family protein [Flavihumibacter sp. UBA7668]|uniref:porin family protein n=1 Tax=Flavihumibacter sp. UBA7668 TaxID=1946542 RepID=UPI0025C50FD4|nr:porin family protein [Flavihumibacter sp. UBA7668]